MYDPYWSLVSLLLTMDGTNGSTTFTDLSTVGNIVSVSGNAAVETSVVKFGTGALNLPDDTSTANTYLSIPVTAGGPLDFFSTSSVVSDFTIEGQFYLTAGGSNMPVVNWSTDTNGNGAGFVFSVSTIGGGSISVQPIGTVIGGAIGNDIAVVLDEWYHWALVRESGNMWFYLNGVLVNVVPPVWINGAPYADMKTFFGWTPYQGGGQDPGYQDEIRVTSGLARYTSNFTPPTAAFPTSAGPPSPTLTSISPNAGDQFSGFPVTLIGTNFDGTESIVVSGAGVTVSELVTASPTELTAYFVIAAGAAATTRTVKVTNDGGDSGTQDFTVDVPAASTYNAQAKYVGSGPVSPATQLSNVTGIHPVIYAPRVNRTVQA